MKKTLLLLCLFGLIIIEAKAQKLRGTDKSPMDMAYYPDNFAHDRKFAPKLIGDMPAIVRITYSRPAKKEREVFGTKIVPLILKERSTLLDYNSLPKQFSHRKVL